MQKTNCWAHHTISTPAVPLHSKNIYGLPSPRVGLAGKWQVTTPPLTAARAARTAILCKAAHVSWHLLCRCHRQLKSPLIRRRERIRVGGGGGGVFLLFFFYDAICTTRKACIVPYVQALLWVITTFKALMTIPFELPTLPSLSCYKVLGSPRQGKQGQRNGHFLAEQLCETRWTAQGFVLGWFRGEATRGMRCGQKCKSSLQSTVCISLHRCVVLALLFGNKIECTQLFSPGFTIQITLYAMIFMNWMAVLM